MEDNTKPEASGDASKERSPSPGKAERHKFHRERPGPYQKGGRNNGRGGPPYNRVLVTNIPYEEKWQALKDLFRQKIGEVTYVELFTDENGRSRGYGVIEFRTKELCDEAVEQMNKYEIMGRNIVVKEDYNGDLINRILRRDGVSSGSSRSLNGGGGASMPHHMPPPLMHPDIPPVRLPQLAAGDALDLRNTIQRNAAAAAAAAAVGPIGKTIFVANLDYKVTFAKLKEVFSLAGRIMNMDLLLDKDNKSRGMATITYDDPMHAAQAISMLNNQLLYDRAMVVKMDKDNGNRDQGFKLPAGLSGIGPTLNARQRSNGGPGDLGTNPAAAVNLLGGNALAASLSALSQASHFTDSLQQNPLTDGRNALGLAGLTAGLSDFTRLASLTGASRELEDRARFLAMAQGLSSGANDRDRIEFPFTAGRDLASKVDQRLREINSRPMTDNRRSITGSRSSGTSRDLPPMPPPMSMTRNGNNISIGLSPNTSNTGGNSMMSSNNNARSRGCTVNVRNIAYTVSWQKLRDTFTACGPVMYADIKTDQSGKSRGFGYVRFEEPRNAQRALQHFDGYEIDGRKLSVQLRPDN